MEFDPAASCNLQWRAQLLAQPGAVDVANRIYDRIVPVYIPVPVRYRYSTTGQTKPV